MTRKNTPKKGLTRTKYSITGVKNPGSKPGKWNSDRCRQGFELALLGATDAQMAEVMGVHLCTIEYWHRTKPAFHQIVSEGKMIADAKVAVSNYKRACGYEFVEETREYMTTKEGIEVLVSRKEVTKHIPGDTTAAIYWLGNRQRGLWQSVNKTEHSGNVSIVHHQPLDLSIFNESEQKMLKSINEKQLPVDGVRSN